MEENNIENEKTLPADVLRKYLNFREVLALMRPAVICFAGITAYEAYSDNLIPVWLLILTVLIPVSLGSDTATAPKIRTMSILGVLSMGYLFICTRMEFADALGSMKAFCSVFLLPGAAVLLYLGAFVMTVIKPEAFDSDLEQLKKQRDAYVLEFLRKNETEEQGGVLRITKFRYLTVVLWYIACWGTLAAMYFDNPLEKALTISTLVLTGLVMISWIAAWISTKKYACPLKISYDAVKKYEQEKQSVMIGE